MGNWQRYQSYIMWPQPLLFKPVWQVCSSSCCLTPVGRSLLQSFFALLLLCLLLPFVAAWSSAWVHTGNSDTLLSEVHVLLSALCSWQRRMLWQVDVVMGAHPHLHSPLSHLISADLSHLSLSCSLPLFLSLLLYLALLSSLSHPWWCQGFSLTVSVSCSPCPSILLFLCSASCWSRSFRPLGCHYWHLSWERSLFTLSLSLSLSLSFSLSLHIQTLNTQLN